MILDEPVVMATDYVLAISMLVMGSRLESKKERILFFAAALTALIGGTRHGFKTTIPPLPLEVGWRIGLAAFGVSSWALATLVLPERFHKFFTVKLAVYLVGLCFIGVFEYAIGNYAFDVTVATLAVLVRVNRNWVFLAGTAFTAVGAVFLRAPWSLGPLPPASLFHLTELAGCYCWYRAMKENGLGPLTSPTGEGISRL